MFCGKCGCEIDADSVFCVNCGSPTNNRNSTNAVSVHVLLQNLIDKLWSEVAFLAVKSTTFFIFFLLECRESGLEAIIFCAIFLLDVISGIKALFETVGFINQIKIKPVGILNKYKTMDTEFSLTYFFFRRHTKKFVLDNAKGFLELESEK